MDETSVNGLAEVAKLLGVTGLSGMVMAFFVRFALRKMVEESTVTQRAIGEAEIIGQLRAEIDRMSTANGGLTKQLNDMQQQVLALRGENAELKVQLHAMNAQLRYRKVGELS